ncbi:MAG TPA: DUF3352 domain-containing protein [Candidatus Omnitrophota bacterium]|nr:hypothetical protein [Candidatus Omnitrophota bacterium]HOX09462.1 DUF3352 domain-containing protein [Candidatus Omnitrophota bacterium]HRZ66522.1 DUF3352 domain-containing protein [Candidatus Omnitrophota bacterium]
MKKSAIIITVISIAVVAVAAGVLLTFTSKPAPIESILPADAVFFMKFSEVDRQVKEFKASKLCKNLERIDIEMLMEKSGAKKEDVENFRAARTELTSFIGGLVLEKYFGKEIAVAVYPSGKIEFTPEGVVDMASNITLATRVKPETKFIDFLAKIFNKAGRKYEVAEENYKGKKMTVVKLDDKVSIAYVQIKDIIVIGLGKKAATSCCDVADRKLLSLAQDKDYTDAMAKFPKGAETVAFGDMGLITAGIKHIADAVPAPKAEAGAQPDPGRIFRDQIDKTLTVYGGFKSFSYAKYPGKITKERMQISLDKAKLIPFFRDFYSVKPRKNTAIKFAPANTIWYSWDTFEWKAYWKYIKEEMGKEAAKVGQSLTFNDMIDGFEKQMGINIENDLIPALGDETGMCLTDINLDGMIPMPHFVIFLKVDKKEAIDRLLAKFTQGGSMQSESYKGTDIKYMNLPFGMAFQPAFCYAGDYFLFSLGREPIKGSIDSYSGAAKSLFENEDFKSVNHGLMDPANKVTYLKVDTLLQKGKGICDWAVRWLTFMSEQQKKVKEMMAAQTDKLKAEIQSLEKELADINAKINDPANTPEAAAELVAKAKEKESMLEMNREQLDQFEVRSQQGGPGQGPSKDFDAALVQLWLDKAVYPVIDGLQSLKAAGSKTVFTDKAIEGESYSKIVE